MIINVLLLSLGLVLLIKGADLLVDGASALAKKYRIPDLTIGLTIVAFGTSAPELVVSIFASLQDHQDIVLGNVIGSNNFNLFIILGICGIITPLAVQSSTVWKEIPMSFVAVLVFFALANDFWFEKGQLTRTDGLVLLSLFALFLYYVYRQLSKDNSVAEITQKNYSLLKIWAFILVGLTGLIIGGKLVVSNAIEIATFIGISEKIIGITIVAVGTSLPELATSLVAVYRKNNDIAVGNIVGSNIFNIFLILAVSSIIKPIDYNPLFNLDLYLLAGGTIYLFLAMFTARRKKLDRWEAAILLFGYLSYIIYIINADM
jgi:cation:H+ antiporter